MKSAISLLLISWSMKYATAATGIATYYGGNLNGNACGMSGTAGAFSNKWFAASGGSNFNSGYGCGRCYKITCKGPDGNNPGCSCASNPTLTVQVIDQCPECAASHFDLNQAAFAKIVAPGKAGTCGRIKITYTRVDCTAIKTNFNVVNKGGTSKYWYGFHLNDVNDDGGIKSVTLYKNSKKAGTCNKSQGPSFWICTPSSGGSFPNTPLSIKITSDKGKSVTAKNCITSYSGGKKMTCNTNLSKGSGFTEEEEGASTISAAGIVAIILVTCCIIGAGVAGYCFIKKRKQKGDVSFENNGADSDNNKDNVDGDGDNNNTKKAGGYDMSPIDTKSGDTPVADDSNDAEIEVEVEQKPTPSGYE